MSQTYIFRKRLTCDAMVSRPNGKTCAGCVQAFLHAAQHPLAGDAAGAARLPWRFWNRWRAVTRGVQGMSPAAHLKRGVGPPAALKALAEQQISTVIR